MDSTAQPTPPPPPDSPHIHEATRAGRLTGAVLKGAEIDFATAVARRAAGLDVVVCGDDLTANRELARSIEATVGPYKQQRFHSNAGPLALPHFQQQAEPPHGHTFYETPNRKARKNP